MIFRILHGFVSFLLIFAHFLAFLLDVRKIPSDEGTDFHYFGPRIQDIKINKRNCFKCKSSLIMMADIEWKTNTLEGD